MRHLASVTMAWTRPRLSCGWGWTCDVLLMDMIQASPTQASDRDTPLTAADVIRAVCMARGWLNGSGLPDETRVRGERRACLGDTPRRAWHPADVHTGLQ